MRDSYTSGYFRQEQKSGLIGIYEHTDSTRPGRRAAFPTGTPRNELFPG